MSQSEHGETVLRSWTHGAKADVDLVDGARGRVIRKRYRPGPTALAAMMREYLALKALQGLNIVPKVIDFLPLHRQLSISFLAGERLLEWVLARYGGPGLDLASFANFHGLDEREDIRVAFRRFRESSATEAVGLRDAITDSYRRLHLRRCVHGDPSPRNLLYDGRVVYLIDFDHWRPSLAPGKIDSVALQRWYGIRL